MPARFPTGVIRLGDVAIRGERLRICCGTCGEIDTKSPHEIAAPLELPLAEVRRMLACTSCGSRWVDVKRIEPNVVLLQGRRRG